MDLKRLRMVIEGEKPLYTLKTGTRYKYLNLHDNEEYTFVKHCEYEFPAHFRFRRKDVRVYQYKVGVPDSHGHLVIFVDECSIVKALEFL